MKQLLAQGVVTEAGLAAYERRDNSRDRAAYEPGVTKLPPKYESRIRADPAAWDYFRNARPSYRKQVARWVVSAKKEETRLHRLGILIESSAGGKVIPLMRWLEKPKG